MDQTYNNLRGIEQFKNKLNTSLQNRNLSQNDIDEFIKQALLVLGDKIGVMPVGDMISAVSAVKSIENHIAANETMSVLDALGTFDFDSMSPNTSAFDNTRLSNNDVRAEGLIRVAKLSDESQEIHDSVIETENLVEVMTYNSDGTPGRAFEVSNIDMIDYIEEEDLTNEGRRNRGFLPADFDSTDVLENQEEYQTGKNRTVGGYGHDASGEIFITCPCGGKDVIPLGAGTYMCLTCEPEVVFDVDLLLEDINPENN
jgi:hypothetical protein